MTKAFKVYLTCWTVIFILFNLIYFLIGKGTIIDKYTITFWISYAFIVVAFLGQLICGYIALNKNIRAENLSLFFPGGARSAPPRVKPRAI